MVLSSREGGLIYNIKLSSVGPGRVTGQDIVFEPNDIDLAMKLHYIRAIYYFNSQAFEGITIRKVKEPMFSWFNHFYMTCGRFRRCESGRPYIKCNDCGARFIEAHCEKTLDEWLEMKKDASVDEKLLVSENIIGPELAFSPLAFFQYTRFKCGGMAVGLSWAHVLGDAFSAVEFMNMLGKVMAGYEPTRPLNLAQSLTKAQYPQTLTKGSEDPLSVKRVDPVGDNWIPVNNCKMKPVSFEVTTTQLSHMQSKISAKIDTFETVCAVFWQSIAKVRNGSAEPKIVTICKKDSRNKVDGILSNSQMINVVKADFSVVDANPSELAALIKNGGIDERKKVEEAMEREKGLADFVVYGAHLTIMNLEEANFYGFEYKGQKPVSASCFIDGVGDEGAVLVLPKDDGSTRIVTVILPENEVEELKSELKVGWSIV